MGSVIEVQDQGRTVGFTFEEMLRYSGPSSPAGVALGFKVLEAAFAVVSPDEPPERREIIVETAFRGPGTRDVCELVTRGVTGGRYVVDGTLDRPDRGHALTTFAFRVSYRDRSVAMVVREGIITDEFVALAQAPERTPDEQARFTALKQAVADQLMATPAQAVLATDG